MPQRDERAAAAGDRGVRGRSRRRSSTARAASTLTIPHAVDVFDGKRLFTFPAGPQKLRGAQVVALLSAVDYLKTAEERATVRAAIAGGLAEALAATSARTRRTWRRRAGHELAGRRGPGGGRSAAAERTRERHGAAIRQVKPGVATADTP